MHSAEHRANILNGGYQHIGVGVSSGTPSAGRRPRRSPPTRPTSATGARGLYRGRVPPPARRARSSRRATLTVAISAIALETALLGMVAPLLPEIERRTGAGDEALGPRARRLCDPDPVHLDPGRPARGSDRPPPAAARRPRPHRPRLDPDRHLRRADTAARRPGRAGHRLDLELGRGPGPGLRSRPSRPQGRGDRLRARRQQPRRDRRSGARRDRRRRDLVRGAVHPRQRGSRPSIFVVGFFVLPRAAPAAGEPKSSARSAFSVAAAAPAPRCPPPSRSSAPPSSD